MRIARKIESYSITHNEVRPLNPLQRANTRDPEMKPRSLERGGVIDRAGRGEAKGCWHDEAGRIHRLWISLQLIALASRIRVHTLVSSSGSVFNMIC